MKYSERICYANILMIMQIELKKPRGDWGNAKRENIIIIQKFK